MDRILTLVGILLLTGILLLAGIASAGGTSYVHGPNGLIARINETNITYYHSDHLGSTSAITNEKGDVVEEQVNLPFGEVISGSERYGFTGKELDSDPNLQYFGARYYDPLTGRFFSVDPAKDGGNWYSYAAGNPLKYTDPDGREIHSTNEELKRFLRIRHYKEVLGLDPEKSKIAFIIEENPDQMSLILAGKNYYETSDKTTKGRFSYYSFSEYKILTDDELSPMYVQTIEELAARSDSADRDFYTSLIKDIDAAGAIIEEVASQGLSYRDRKTLQILDKASEDTDIMDLIEREIIEKEFSSNNWFARFNAYQAYKKIQNQKLNAQYRLIKSMDFGGSGDYLYYPHGLYGISEYTVKRLKKLFKEINKGSVRRVKEALKPYTIWP